MSRAANRGYNYNGSGYRSRQNEQVESFVISEEETDYESVGMTERTQRSSNGSEDGKNVGNEKENECESESESESESEYENEYNNLVGDFKESERISGNEKSIIKNGLKELKGLNNINQSVNLEKQKERAKKLMNTYHENQNMFVLWVRIIDRMIECHYRNPYLLVRNVTPNVLHLAIEYIFNLNCQINGEMSLHHNQINNRNFAHGKDLFLMRKIFESKVALWMSNKFEEGCAIDSNFLTDDLGLSLLNHDEISQLEAEFGKCINYQFCHSTRFVYGMRYLEIMGINVESVISEKYCSQLKENVLNGTNLKNEMCFVKFSFLVRYLIEMSYFCLETFKYSNEMVAICCVYLAFCVSKPQIIEINSKLGRLLKLRPLISNSLESNLMKRMLRIARSPHDCMKKRNRNRNGNNNNNNNNNNDGPLSCNLFCYRKYNEIGFLRVSNIEPVQTSAIDEFIDHIDRWQDYINAKSGKSNKGGKGNGRSNNNYDNDNNNNNNNNNNNFQSKLITPQATSSMHFEFDKCKRSNINNTSDDTIM